MLKANHSTEFHDMGLALRVYGIDNNISCWRYRERIVERPTGSIETQRVMLGDIEMEAAKWSDIDV